ncbi:TIGR03943 family putative permease subunit [Streptomyces griseorubiginosus]|uniref:TIGR03943 family putative permease subunit n=1 Tax=Streptomyces griseorubiginosus TaxID=67304 RepID=UPI002E814C06|nr:TIGR03943 family protein [Streptomyces griseorubiginosus]WUB45672.1 TIGR03943 family protein [Streptomyces griseorubiginosus]WUB54190.1 TIGR03943 family protein [Streptomyces griseorubiginosus]
MRRYVPCLLLALVGAAVLRISLFGELYLRYVQAGLRPYLVVSGGALVLLGAAMAVVRRTGWEVGHEASLGDGHDVEHGDGPDAGHGHSHGAAGPRVAWLLTLPALALLLFPPPALGSYSAEREAAQRAAQGVGTFPALPAGNPVELTLGEFSSRAVYDSGRSLRGRTVRMTGFVTHGDDGTWYLTRLFVTCCAADATTSKVEVRGAADGAPPVDTWVTVTGTWHPEGRLGTDSAWPPVVDASAVERVGQPADPYEKR